MNTNETRVPCDCGSPDAIWHGDTARVYCCHACWSVRTDLKRGLCDKQPDWNKAWFDTSSEVE